MARKQHKSITNAPESTLTLAELAAKYMAHLEEQGKSAGTCFSYGMELRIAQCELGAETLVAALSPEAIARFNTSARVTLLKSGKPKSPLSIDKTRRVLRLALTWAHQEGLLASAVVDSKKDALPGEDAADALVGAHEAQCELAAPKAKRERKRATPRGLEVSRAEAEAAADIAEAAIACTESACAPSVGKLPTTQEAAE